MKRIIFVLLIALIASSCGVQRKTYCERKENKVARILKDCPNIIKTETRVDTVYITDTFNILVDSPIDSSTIDSLLLAYCDAVNLPAKDKEGNKDSVRTVTIRKYIFKECEKINDGKYILKDNYGQTVIVNIKGREITVITSRAEIKEEATVVTPSVQESNWRLFKAWWGLLFLLLVVGFVFGWLARR